MTPRCSQYWSPSWLSVGDVSSYRNFGTLYSILLCVEILEVTLSKLPGLTVQAYCFMNFKTGFYIEMRLQSENSISCATSFLSRHNFEMRPTVRICEFDITWHLVPWTSGGGGVTKSFISWSKHNSYRKVVCGYVWFLHDCLDVSYMSWDISKNQSPCGNHTTQLSASSEPWKHSACGLMLPKPWRCT